jgi:hypothetical protein
MFSLGLISSGSSFHSFKVTEVDHLCPSGAELKIAWRCTTASSTRCGAEVQKHGTKFYMTPLQIVFSYIYQIPKVKGVWGTSCGKTESAIAVNFYFNKCYCYRLFIVINAHKSSSYINASINISNGIQLD